MSEERWEDTAEQPRSQATAKRQRNRLLMLAGLITVLLIAAVAVLAMRIRAQFFQDSAEESFAEDCAVLSLTVIDVGQGDALLLRSPSGKTMLIDSGPDSAYDAVMQTLAAYGIERLDAAVATHPHLDHIGAMADILLSVPVDTFYITDTPSATERYRQMLLALQQCGCTVRKTEAPMTIAWDEDVSVTVLNPLPNQEYEEINNTSIVLKVTYGDVSFLLTGDLETDGEQLLLAVYGSKALRADVLKLGHHGSMGATSDLFLDAVRPRIAIASAGKDNDYGHPHYQLLERLEEHGISLYRTDLDGNITVQTDGTRVIVVP